MPACTPSGGSPDDAAPSSLDAAAEHDAGVVPEDGAADARDAGALVEGDAGAATDDGGSAVPEVDAGGVFERDAGTMEGASDAGAGSVPLDPPPASGIVDARGNVGNTNAIVVDEHGTVFIAYGDASNQSVKLARSRAGGFSLEVVSTHAERPAIALAPDGAPHIAFRTTDIHVDLKYATWDGSAWGFETITAEGYPNHIVLAIAPDGTPQVAYRVQEPLHSHFEPMFAVRDGTHWGIETLEYIDGGGGYALALDALGRANLTYNYDAFRAGRVRYARWDGARWAMSFVSGCDAGFGIRLSSDGVPRVLCSTDSGLAVLRFGGDVWESDSVDGAATSGALAIDSAGHEHVAFCASPSADTSELRLARKTADGWDTRTVAPRCGWLSLAVDRAGNDHIGYYDPVDANLEYAFVPASP